MAETLMPGDILTETHAKIVFNAPFAEKHVYHIKLVNHGGLRIGWAIKTTNMQRHGVDPACGVLAPNKAARIAVSCEPLDVGEPGVERRRRYRVGGVGRPRGVAVDAPPPPADRLIFEWTNTPDGATPQFRREWFQGNGMVRRKNLPCEYNP